MQRTLLLATYLLIPAMVRADDGVALTIVHQADDTGANDQKVKFLFHASNPQARSRQGTKPEDLHLSTGFGSIHPAILSA